MFQVGPAAFTTPCASLPHSIPRNLTLCPPRLPHSPARARPFLCMEAHNPSPPSPSTTNPSPRLGAFTTWPPSEMTPEWAEAVERLSSCIRACTYSVADAALTEADGDEILALRLLTEKNKSEIQQQRELAVERARAAGDTNRVSALREAELRRRVTGSAKGFFKGFVEAEGKYVDQGYVDESSDVMGNLAKKVRGWFGGQK